MAAALTEVVLQVRLPDGALSHLLRAAPYGRIVVTPLASDGSYRPSRLLASVSGVPAPRETILEALASLLAEVEPIGDDDRAVHAVGEPAPGLALALDGLAGEALMGRGRDLVLRPALIQGDWIHAAVVATREAPMEEVVQRLAGLLGQRGIPARLVRIAPYHAEQQPLALYEEMLTPKQVEILKMALALGLYDTPRRCTLDDLAEIFGISKAAAHNRMKGAERKILAQYFA